ncbi:MAG TPA: hypothetical protein VKC66_07960 [Xanthobacteraceae bacterium]|nr:hypothetical protein [Xanthobacteraceae bacterium]
MTKPSHNAIPVELTAVIVAVTGEEPRVLTIQDFDHNFEALPTGPFESGHRTLQIGLRSWVERQTHHPLGYIEQLYTFADRDRTRDGAGERLVSISYLGLTREEHATGQRDPRWQSWYRFLPWEDWRSGPPALVTRIIASRLRGWTKGAGDGATRRDRKNRIEIAFGLSGRSWNEELTLQRYELLYEAGLVPEAKRRGRVVDPLPGVPMMHDHRRILATGVARLRAKIKYRPVVFELMPERFTLLALQRTVEALAGRQLHKQNFRRLIDQQGLVEDTGDVATQTGGRPAKLVRFRRDLLLERAVAGTKLPLSVARPEAAAPRHGAPEGGTERWAGRPRFPLQEK